MATFSAVRSANRNARTAESAFLESLRPVIMPSRVQDPPEKVMWAEGRWTRVEGGRAAIEQEADNLYFVLSLRNAGAGIGVLQGWFVTVAPEPGAGELERPDLVVFRRQFRDLYIPPGDFGFWQGAIRDRGDDAFDDLQSAVVSGSRLAVYLLYSDLDGGQRTISMFTLNATTGTPTVWLTSVLRHWNLDRADPR